MLWATQQNKMIEVEKIVGHGDNDLGEWKERRHYAGCTLANSNEGFLYYKKMVVHIEFRV